MQKIEEARIHVERSEEVQIHKCAMGWKNQDQMEAHKELTIAGICHDSFMRLRQKLIKYSTGHLILPLVHASQVVSICIYPPTLLAVDCAFFSVFSQGFLVDGS